MADKIKLFTKFGKYLEMDIPTNFKHQKIISFKGQDYYRLFWYNQSDNTYYESTVLDIGTLPDSEDFEFYKNKI